MNTAKASFSTTVQQMT